MYDLKDVISLNESPNLKVIKLSDRFWWLMADSWLCFVLWPLAGIHLKNTVFVAFADENLRIECNLSIPANKTADILTCSDPSHTQIYKYDIPETHYYPRQLIVELELKRLNNSGEYTCQYKTAKVFWFLHLRGKFGWQDTIIFIMNIITFRLDIINWFYVVMK